MNHLLEILKEQASFGFTGRINVLKKENNQFVGVVYQQDGIIVGANCEQLKSKKALMKLVIDDVESIEELKFIVEPELVAEGQVSLKLTYDELKKEAQKLYQNYLATKKLRPPQHLKLLIDPNIIVNSEEITSEEFDVLLILSEWSKVSDVYRYCKLLDFEITNALVSLRKKKAIKVFQN